MPQNTFKELAKLDADRWDAVGQLCDKLKPVLTECFMQAPGALAA